MDQKTIMIIAAAAIVLYLLTNKKDYTEKKPYKCASCGGY
jgi:hypothetical protein